MSGQKFEPLIFEIHHDRADDKGRPGLIGSPLVADNSVYRNLQADFGEYSPNYSYSSHGNYGGPRSGMALIELGRSYKNWTPEIIEANTNKLWGSLMKNEGVKSGQRQMHFFVGHGDVVTGQTGAPGEREMNRAVIKRLQAKAKAAGLNNFNFYRSHPVVHGSKGGPKDNWTRARNIRAGKDGGLRWSDDGSATLASNPDADASFSASTPTNPESSASTFNQEGGSVPGAPVAKERAQQFTQRKRTASEVVEGLGNNFGEMKSQRLADALKGAQEAIIQKRMDAGERFGSVSVPKGSSDDTSTANPPAARQPADRPDAGKADTPGETRPAAAPPTTVKPKQTPAPAETLYYGDSVATGLGHGSREGDANSDARWGRGAPRTLELLKSRPEGTFKGKNVVLSTGVLNSGPDWDVVRQQVDHLKGRGATVQLVGAPKGSQRFAGFNDQLQSIAEQTGSQFLGGYDAPDGVHPTYSSYPTYRKN